MTDNEEAQRRKRLVVLTLLALLAIAAAIFFFSSESGEESNSTSLFFAKLYLRVTQPGFDSLPENEQAGMLENAQHVVRKCAHFLEYTAFAFFLRLFLYGIYVPHWLSFILTLLLGVAYAGLDEYHQYLVGSRTAMWQDVVLDSAGVLFGLLIATLVVVRRVKKKENATQE